MLGYGIGANLYMLYQKKIAAMDHRVILSSSMLILSLASLATTAAIIYLPIRVEYLVNLFSDLNSVVMLLTIYSIFMIPFILIGFIVVYLFSVHSRNASTLYCFDLIGAGMGALLFFPLINKLSVFHSILFLTFFLAILALSLLLHKRTLWMSICFGVWIFAFLLIPEPVNYTVDKAKGWEWIPGHFEDNKYEVLVHRWHPLGRTDIYRIADPATRDQIYASSVGTFEINLTPRPEFSYITTNFLAGAPIYHLAPEGMAEYGSKIALFSQAMEFPYALLDKPKVLIIGVGGGRDVFMAATHRATEILGAEINPGIFAELSAGGKLYDYSGRIYTAPGANILNVDGRHLVKKMPPGSFDLIVLNGVDTFSGLSTGAYAYAESYLYTKEALKDYLQIIGEDGFINFNRWLFPGWPRETLRLFAIALQALKETGATEPWNHIMIGSHQRWSLVLIKKTPLTSTERTTIKNYFQEHDTSMVFPTQNWKNPDGSINGYFDYYAEMFSEGHENVFARFYPFDISVISDDNPFFYKYYKFNPSQFLNIAAHHHTGTIIFLTQTLVLIQALFFIILFIFLPLLISKRKGINELPQKAVAYFVIFFGCLGSGYMLIEIALMQKFVLLLGNPIYSISVTLSVLLISSGLGSLFLPVLENKLKTSKNVLMAAAFSSFMVLAFIILFSSQISNQLMHLSFGLRILAVCLFIAPLGACLGVFFPAGIQLISKNHNDTIAWAWALNGGFSVLGSIMAIILAQFWGFNNVLLLAAAVYLLAVLSYRRMSLSIT